MHRLCDSIDMARPMAQWLQVHHLWHSLIANWYESKQSFQACFDCKISETEIQ